MSKNFYEALGPTKSLLAFKSGDGTHHNNYGSYELAKCVIEGIRSSGISLGKYVLDDLPRFDPGKPDAVETFNIPASPNAIGLKPLGN
jgi:hypothetical protein